MSRAAVVGSPTVWEERLAFSGQEIIFAAIDEVNETLPDDEQIAKAPDTPILGTDSGVDSLTIVNLVVAIEQEIQACTGKSVVLIDEETMALESHPFQTVESLVNYIEGLIN